MAASPNFSLSFRITTEIFYAFLISREGATSPDSLGFVSPFASLIATFYAVGPYIFPGH
jgi:hypothetical protein